MKNEPTIKKNMPPRKQSLDNLRPSGNLHGQNPRWKPSKKRGHSPGPESDIGEAPSLPRSRYPFGGGAGQIQGLVHQPGEVSATLRTFFNDLLHHRHFLSGVENLSKETSSLVFLRAITVGGRPKMATAKLVFERREPSSTVNQAACYLGAKKKNPHTTPFSCHKRRLVGKENGGL